MDLQRCDTLRPVLLDMGARADSACRQSVIGTNCKVLVPKLPPGLAPRCCSGMTARPSYRRFFVGNRRPLFQPVIGLPRGHGLCGVQPARADSPCFTRRLYSVSPLSPATNRSAPPHARELPRAVMPPRRLSSPPAARMAANPQAAPPSSAAQSSTLSARPSTPARVETPVGAPILLDAADIRPTLAAAATQRAPVHQHPPVPAPPTCIVRPACSP